MGYRAAFLSNAGSIAVHSEAFLHAVDREIGPRPMNVLLADVGNGGPHELWEQVLPEGSRVKSIDTNPECAVLPIGVTFCDVEDKADVNAVLAGSDRFDVIVDATGTLTPWMWPWLREGGIMIYENIREDDRFQFLSLAGAVMSEDHREEILPVEEVLRVNIYGPVVSVEKRSPKVVPYLDVMTGNFGDVIPESDLLRDGVKRAIVAG